MSDRLLGFPSPFKTAKEKKSPKYGLEYAKAIWSRAQHGRFDAFYSRQKRIIENREWARGTQSIDHLKDLVSTGGDLSYLSMNWNVANPIPNLVNTFVNKTVERDYDVVVSALDKTSKGELDKIRLETYNKVFMKKNKARLEELGLKISDLEAVESAPDSFADADFDLELNAKTELEEFLETGINFVFNNNGIEEIKETVARDIFENGYGFVRTGFDHNRDPYIRAVDIKNFGFSYCKKRDFSDWAYFYEILEMPLSQLRMRLGDKAFTEDEWFNIAKSSAGQYGNQSWTYGSYYGERNYDFSDYADFNILAMDFVFKTVDQKRFIKKQTKKGNGYYYEERDLKQDLKKERGIERVDDKNIEVMYEGLWIVGTQHIRDYKLCENMLRPREDGIYSTRVVSPFVGFATDLLDMETKSKVEQMTPIAEQMMLLDLKTQQIIAQSRPSGLAIDAYSIASVQDALGIDYDTEEAIAMYDQKGSVFYSSKGEDGSHQNNRPITELANGIPNNIITVIELYNAALAKLYQVSGFNPSVDGTSTDKDALVGVERMREAAHNNAVRHLTSAYAKIIGSAARNCGLLVQDALEFYGKQKGWDFAIGNLRVEGLKDSAKYNYAEMGITIRFRPTHQEMQDFIDSLAISLQNQQIDVTIMTRAKRIASTSIKAAERYLEGASKKFQEAKFKESLQLQEANGKVQMESNVVSEQQKRETLQLEYDLKLRNEIEVYRLGRIPQEEVRGDKDIERAIVEGDIKKELVELATDQTPQSSDLRQTSIPKSSGVREPKVFPQQAT